METSSPTKTPPVSSAVFHVNPKSFVLMMLLAEAAIRTLPHGSLVAGEMLSTSSGNPLRNKRIPDDQARPHHLLGRAVRNHKELIGFDRIVVLDRSFFRNPEMDESGRDC